MRCAIYTRKSSEEGLEQEFNSLQAQREACEAFITSQVHEGWVCLRTGYDDGGFSGATMGRPALQRLLADITARRVDTIVVYKIDRLTRSLADFAKSEMCKENQHLTMSNLRKWHYGKSNIYLITDYPQPRRYGTNQEHATVSAGLSDGAQQGPVSKGPQ